MTYSQKASKSRAAVLAGIFALIALYCGAHISVGQDVVLRCVISATPLAIFIPGVAARRYRSGSLLCFVLLIYFMVESQALFVPGGLIYDAITMSVVVVLFTLSMFYARWQQRADVFEGDAVHGK